MKISNDFALSEFVQGTKTAVFPAQWFMLKALCTNILQPLRDFLHCKLTVTDGVRNMQDYNRLVSQGYAPSETSDHFFGVPVMLLSPEKIAKFGKAYSFSVGAADVIPECGTIEAYERIKKFIDFKSNVIILPNGPIVVGQFILEKSPKASWFHISNPATLIYSKNFAEKFLSKRPFLISNDNGKTYQPLT